MLGFAIIYVAVWGLVYWNTYPLPLLVLKVLNLSLPLEGFSRGLFKLLTLVKLKVPRLVPRLVQPDLEAIVTGSYPINNLPILIPKPLINDSNKLL